MSAQKPKNKYSVTNKSFLMGKDSDLSLPPPDVVREVRRTELDSPLSELVQTYNERIGIRDEYLWKWLSRSFQFVTLDCVAEGRFQRVCTHKTILAMYVTLVDDLAENINDTATFQEARKIPFSDRSAAFDSPEVDTTYLGFLAEVWETVEALIEDTDQGSEFRPFLTFDLRQAVNAIDYERLANSHPEMMNTTEMLAYTPHNMMMLAAADLDLMYSPDVDQSDISAIRHTVHQGQELVRITNWTSTWERELDEGDITSAVFSQARSNGVLSTADLTRIRDADASIDTAGVESALKDSGVEQELLDTWELKYNQLKSNVPDVDSVDLSGFVEGIRKVREYHMESKGFK